MATDKKINPVLASVFAACAVILTVYGTAFMASHWGGQEVTPEPAVTVTVESTTDLYGCKQAEWDSYVDEWNQLVTERDAKGLVNVTVDGVEYPAWEDYATQKGWPLTFEEHLMDDASGTC